MSPISYKTFCLVEEHLNCQIFICEPSDILMCQTPECVCYAAPEETTEEDVLDILQRSIEQGKNLFIEEWQEYHFDKNVVY